MTRRCLGLVIGASIALSFVGCKKQESAGSTKGEQAAAPAEDDPWDPKPKNADAPPPPLASKLGEGAGDELAKLAEMPGAGDKPASATGSAAEVSKDGLPTQAVRGFAGISQTGFRVAYATSKDPVHEQFRAVLEEHKVFELVAQGLNQTIRMPKTIDIQLVDCGAINAFYDPNNSRIIVCYELLSYFVDIFRGNVASDDQLGQAVIGATLFGFYHELGHALIHQLKLPTMGREEDSADQIATLLLMEAGDDGVGMALSGAYWFNLQQKSGGNETPFWDEHAFDGQRYYNILCLIYGSNTTKYAGFVESGNLPAARAQRCAEEYAKIRESFQTLIAPHLTNNSPQEIEYTAADPPAQAPPAAEGESESGPFEAPEVPAEAHDDHAITCDQVAEKAIDLIGAEAEKQFAKLTDEQRAQATEELKANLPAFLEQFLAQCASEDWPDKDRRCVLEAADIQQAGRCGIE